MDIMETEATRATVCIENSLHQLLRPKTASSRRSMSEIVNDALRRARTRA